MSKTLALMLFALLAMSSSVIVEAVFAQPSPLPTPSTIAPSRNYTVRPLSSLYLKVSLSHGLGPLGGCGGLIYIKGGSGNDINFRVVDPQGKTILDLGRISNEKEFYIFPDETGNYTIVLDNDSRYFLQKKLMSFHIVIPIISLSLLGFQSIFG